MTFGKRTYISPSQIKMLMDCPTKWWWSYVKRPPVTKLAWLPFGGSYHKALEAYFSVKGKEPFSIIRAQKVFDGAFATSLRRQECSFVGTPGKAEFERRGKQFVDLYLRKMGHLQPTMVEKKFNLKVGDGSFHIKGVIDLVTRDVVVDHKTANKSWLRGPPSHGWAEGGDTAASLEIGPIALHWAKLGDRATQEIQSYAYPWAYWRMTGEIPDRFEFHVVSPQGLEVHRIRRTEKELEWFERLAKAYFKMAQGDVFPPRDNWWGCNSRWCDYWKYCKGKYQVQRTDF